MKFKKGVVFGVFDGLHEGHKYFLNEALSAAEELIVVVALDSAVIALKGKKPKHTLQERVDAIGGLNSSLRVVAGDEIKGEWSVIHKEEPNMVFLGHDQGDIAEELAKLGVVFQYLSAHEPERYKSSILYPEG